jgi:NAD(P)-dependent dehydrogenase (short-subunit alcohol dehydrogenase family)
VVAVMAPSSPVVATRALPLLRSMGLIDGADSSYGRLRRDGETIDGRGVEFKGAWRPRGAGRSPGQRAGLVTITSSAATHADRERVGYCGSEAVVLLGSRADALDPAEHHICGQRVAPRAVDTPLLRQLHTAAAASVVEQAAGSTEVRRALSPQGRVGDVGDIAAPVGLLGLRRRGLGRRGRAPRRGRHHGMTQHHCFVWSARCLPAPLSGRNVTS